MLTKHDLEGLELDTWLRGPWIGLRLVRIRPVLWRTKRMEAFKQPRVVYRDADGLFIINDGLRVRFDADATRELERFAEHIRVHPRDL